MLFRSNVSLIGRNRLGHFRVSSCRSRPLVQPPERPLTTQSWSFVRSSPNDCSRQKQSLTEKELAVSFELYFGRCATFRQINYAGRRLANRFRNVFFGKWRELTPSRSAVRFGPRLIRSNSSPSYSRRRQEWMDYTVLTLVYVPLRCGKNCHGSVCRNLCRRSAWF